MVAQTNHQYTKYVVENTETVICLRIEKTNTAKTPPGDFKVITPEIPLLSQQAVTRNFTALVSSVDKEMLAISLSPNKGSRKIS